VSEHKQREAGKLITLLGRGEKPATPPMPEREDCCSNCFFGAFDTPEAASPGLCHANPPQVFVLMTQDRITGGVKQDVNACFPPIGRAAWCGLFEPAIVTPNEPDFKHLRKE
jgi:hypothetical protein